ncbi:uncharacterized protein N7484_001545 [Penicillium longicatenatum]|uniref:uncharacterized protein n=1 Tax=Penicillium longicatenatum TaxID=1561947 RepID=UPI002548A5A1|nr:uncharacterized protein N7484_001545 [Penicillium longicatenatum]KAJ5657896.1 hypothetical protein N7484_001545 [Penicillium longicatenatum]
MKLLSNARSRNSKVLLPRMIIADPDFPRGKALQVMAFKLRVIYTLRLANPTICVVAYPTPAQPQHAFKREIRRHWKRFWLLYCIGNVIFLAIFLPIFFLVVIPAIAQLVVDKSDLVLVNAVVNQPKPDSVILTLQTKVDLKLAIPARIEDLPLSLFQRAYGVKDAYASVTLPGQTIKGNHTMGVTDQHTPLQNMTAWEEFVHQVVFQEKTSLAVAGETNAYLGVLKSHVHLNKDIVTPTLNKFNGFSIADATLILPAESDGTNLIGNATLPNPSVITLEVGVITMDIKAGDLTIGNTTLSDVTLVPGENVFPLRGTLDLKTVIKNLAAVLKAEASAIKNGNLSINAVATSVVWNGTLVPYYTDILNELTLTTSIGLGALLKNTINYLKSEGNLTDILKNVTGDMNLSSITTRSLDENYRGPVDLSGFMRSNLHVRDMFKDVDPDERDLIIDSLASVYPEI